MILVQQRKQAKIGFETFRSKYIKLCVSSDVGKKEIRSERKRTCFLRRSNMRFSIRALSINKLELRSFTGKMDDLDDEWGKDIHTGWPAPSSISRNSLSMG